MLNHDVLSHDVLNHDVLIHDLLNHVLSYEVLSHDVLNYDVLSHDVLKHDMLSHEVLSHDVLNHDVISHDVLNHDMLNYSACKQTDKNHVFDIVHCINNDNCNGHWVKTIASVTGHSVARYVCSLAPLTPLTCSAALHSVLLCYARFARLLHSQARSLTMLIPSWDS